MCGAIGKEDGEQRNRRLKKKARNGKTSERAEGTFRDREIKKSKKETWLKDREATQATNPADTVSHRLRHCWRKTVINKINPNIYCHRLNLMSRLGVCVRERVSVFFQMSLSDSSIFIALACP